MFHKERLVYFYGVKSLVFFKAQLLKMFTGVLNFSTLVMSVMKLKSVVIIPATLDMEAEGSKLQTQPGQLSEILFIKQTKQNEIGLRV